MSTTLLPAASRSPQTWRNGGGVTFEVARAAPPAGSMQEFLWRVSIARVDRAGAFSSFAGFQRLITVIEGGGMMLRGLGRSDVTLRPFDVLPFDGAASITGLLPHGPVMDLNVIYDPTRCHAELTIVEHAVPERSASRDELLVINLGEAAIDCRCNGRAQLMQRHDALWIRDPRAQLECRHLERAALIEVEHLPAR